jgi:LCP family protein required for cell wall assembly
VIDTLQSNFGIPINHYVEVDFASFEGIVNAIGKVPVFVPAEARDTYTGFSVPGPGCYELDGQQALQYVRSRAMEFYDREAGVWRDTDAIPDFGRINRQQNFIRRLGSLAYQEALGNPLKANEIADDVVPQLTVDGDLSREDIFKLVKTFRTIDPADPTAVEMVTLPTRGETSSDGQSILELDQPDADAIIERLKSFTPAPVPGEGILPAQVDVRVLNGSGVEGLAASTLDSLQRQYGFSGAGFGNAQPSDETVVRHRPGLEDAAELVRSYLGGAGRLVESSKIADADVVVVLGPDFDALSTPPGVTPAATAPASTASTTARNPLEGIPAIDFQAILEGRCVP